MFSTVTSSRLVVPTSSALERLPRKVPSCLEHSSNDRVSVPIRQLVDRADPEHKQKDAACRMVSPVSS